ncbi:MAG: tetratricopeptide repeat protein [Endomicrobium sp.]|jgi:tetratricopeptide (TPR) repeat protein|nr:tetratricopeptide repeat protein [Endomicrobium sp.]
MKNFLNICKAAIYAAFLVLMFALYYQCVFFDYTSFDDSIFLLENKNFISSYKNIPEIFKNPVFNMGGASDYYRPILTLSFLTDNLILGDSPASHHFFNILFHLLSVFLLFIFLRKFKFDETFTFLFTLLFSVHPAFAHAAAWIPGRNDSLLAIFTISSFICLYNYCNKDKIANLFAALFLLFLALLTKESAVSLVILLPVFAFLFFKNMRKKALLIFTGALLTAMVYAFIRNSVLANSAPLSAPSVFYSVFSQCRVFLNYIEYVIILSHIYLFADKLPITPLTIISSAIAFIPIFASIIFKIGERKIILFGFFWFIIFLAPTFIVINEYLPHRIYAASIGLIIAYLEFFTALAKKAAIKKYLTFFLAVFALMFSFAQMFQLQKFKDRETFISVVVQESRDSQIARLKLAEYYAGRGMLAQARGELDKVDKSKREMEYLEILGWVCALEKKYEDAKNIYEKILTLAPNREPSLNNLAEIYNQLGRRAEAVKLYDKLIALHPEKIKYSQWRKEIIDNIRVKDGGRYDQN